VGARESTEQCLSAAQSILNQLRRSEQNTKNILRINEQVAKLNAGIQQLWLNLDAVYAEAMAPAK
jgi:hypothetical protein